MLDWGEWSYYKSHPEQLYFGFYIPGVGFYAFNNYSSPNTIIDIDTEHLSFQIQDADFNVGSTYKIYPVLTTHSVLYTHTWLSLNESATGTWWFMPIAPVAQFTVSAPVTPGTKVYFSGNSMYAWAYENSYMVTIQDISFDIQNTNSFAINCTVKAKTYSPYSGTINIGTTTVTVPANGYITDVIPGSAYFEPIDNSVVSVDLELTFIYAGETFTRQTSFNTDVEFISQ